MVEKKREKLQEIIKEGKRQAVNLVYNLERNIPEDRLITTNTMTFKPVCHEETPHEILLTFPENGKEKQLKSILAFYAQLHQLRLMENDANGTTEKLRQIEKEKEARGEVFDAGVINYFLAELTATNPPSPIVMWCAGKKEQVEISPKVPNGTPFQVDPKASQVSSKKIKSYFLTIPITLSISGGLPSTCAKIKPLISLFVSASKRAST